MEQEVLHSSVQQGTEDKSIFGFWLYLMTDLIMFAVLFAAYAVLRGNSYGGPTAEELLNLPLALQGTLLLLTSSFTCGIGMVYASRREKVKTLVMFGLTFLLGLAFLWLELSEFSQLVSEGQIPQANAFLSAFFTLVGTHGLHITFGLIWLGIMLIAVLRRGLTTGNIRKLYLMSLFWHFLDIVWIFIFTVVYLFKGIV